MDGGLMSKTKTPAGYESVDEFLQEARERFQEDQDYDRENRDEAKTDLEFLAGEQWEPEDVTARGNRPCLTINRLPQFVAQVVGDIRINKPGIKVRPAEDADKDLASIREGLIRAIEHDSKAQNVYASAGQSQVACGIGNFRVKLEYAAEDAFDRDIRIKAIPNPFAVVWDANMTDPTGADAGHCFVTEDMPRKAFEARYPDETDDSTFSAAGDSTAEDWQSKDVVRVCEYWVMKETPVEIAMLQDGSIREFTPELQDQVMIRDDGQPMLRKSFKRTACMYLITGRSILDGPYEYPISRVPIFRVPGWEISTGAKTVRFGLVRFAKDPQRLMNYWRSVSAEVLALAPRQQWLVHETQEGDQDDFRNAATSGDTVLAWNGQIPPQRIDPPPIPAAVLQEAALNAQDMKDVTGLHDASLGAKSNETSGRAILARQKEGDVASYIYHDNLKAAIGECGRVVNQLIPVVFDTARTIRVLGDDEQQKVMRVNDPSDPKSIDLAKGRYDIVVETGPSYSTKRVEAAESMMQFVQAVPQAGQVAGDLIAMAQDWPKAEEIGDRLKKTLPPGVVEEEEPKSPEEAQARQAQAQQAQQQQQMMQQAAMLEMAQKEAEVMKTQAEAQNIMAQAQAANRPETGGETPLDEALKMAQLRKAEADADKAEMEAVRARIAVESDRMDLERKPIEAANQAADLKIKLNPPEPEAA
jgi:hypothetical protein